MSIAQGPGGMHLNSQRHAESALMSWKAGKVGSGSLTSALSLSTRSSDIDLKEFINQRGIHYIRLYCQLCIIYIKLYKVQE